MNCAQGKRIGSFDYVLRRLAEGECSASLPFGGRNVVFAADTFQLESYEGIGSIQVKTRDTAYQSRSWYLKFGSLGDGVVVVLHHNHRQLKDPGFFQMLNRIRVGGHSAYDLSLLNHTSSGIPMPTEECTRLFPTNAHVSEINRDILSKFPGDLLCKTARDTFHTRRSIGLESRLNIAAPKEVSLKVGARVILTRKIGSTLPVTQGVITRVMNMTRIRNNRRYLVDVRVSSLDPNENGKCVRVGFVSFDVHGYSREVIASREQLPLIPGYAMTIHRSQGMTMEHVAIDFSAVKKWRPVGLVYVALSRCRALSGLWVKNLKHHHIRVSPRAFQLMNDLWTLKMHLPSRVYGVQRRSCLGFDDTKDVISISDEEGEQENSAVLVCDNTHANHILNKEILIGIEVSETSTHKRFYRGADCSWKT